MARETDRICPLDPPCVDCWDEGAGALREWLTDRREDRAAPLAAAAPREPRPGPQAQKAPPP